MKREIIFTEEELIYLLGLIECQIGCYDFMRGFKKEKNDRQLFAEKLRNRFEKILNPK